MGIYDALIQVPVPGQPISTSQYGIPVRNAIIDLDRRLTAFDGSTGVAIAKATTNQTLAIGSAETLSLTIAGFTFRAGYAYQATLRCGIRNNAAATGQLTNLRLRKNTVAGTDYGEFYRFNSSGNGLVNAALGAIYLIRDATTDLVADVLLTAQTAASNTATVDLFATTASPRYLVISPVGFASDYTGMGATVT